jgi:hypothetical protein
MRPARMMRALSLGLLRVFPSQPIDRGRIGDDGDRHVDLLYLRYDGGIASGTDNHALTAGLRLSWYAQRRTAGVVGGGWSSIKI